jgi:hypothetical protein
MSIVPVTPFTGTILQLAHTDPDAAAELLRFGLYESLLDQIDANRTSLDAEGNAFIAKRAADARVHLLRTYVSKALDGKKPADSTQIAENLAIIDEYVSKAGFIRRTIGGAIGGALNQTRWDESEHKRGAGGRFVDMTSVGPGAGGNRTEMNRTKAMEIAEEAERHKKSGHLDSGDNIGLRFKGRNHDADKPLRSTVGNIDRDMQENTKQNGQYLVGAVYDPARTVTGTTATEGANRGAYDAMLRMTNDPAMAARFSGSNLTGSSQVNHDATGKWGSSNAAEWNNLTSGTDRQSYRRMEMTGHALTSISAPGSNVHTAGAIAQIIGNLGPEAEKILGPGVRRTAYRYRGTEKRPDAKMMANNRKITQAAHLLDRRNPQADEVAQTYINLYNHEEKGQTKRGDSFGRTDPSFTPPPRDPDQVVATIGYNLEEAQNDGLNPQQMAMRMRGDMVATSLIPTLPKAKLTALSQEAGDTPPSTGVLINASGQIVSEAQGFNGDHYLPFDLKNLRAMHGGQYVRTRSNGGPTTEDIYTGLIGGARQMQVVSNSGVYTVEFDPDLRGGRRYSDKAAKMVRRYAQILDRIATEQVNSQDLPKERISEIYRDSMEAMNWDQEKGMKEFTASMKKERLRNAAGAGIEGMTGQENITTQIEDEFSRRRALPENATASRNALDMIHREVSDELRSKQVKTYKLDGPGYATALEALKTEFPYYIRDVKYQELPEFRAFHGMARSKDKVATNVKDSAYVAPGHTAYAGQSAGYIPKEKGGKAHAAGGRKTRDASAAAAFQAAEDDRKLKEAGGESGLSGGGSKRNDITSTARLAGADKEPLTFGQVSITPHPDTKTLEKMIAVGSPANRKLAESMKGFFDPVVLRALLGSGKYGTSNDPVTSQNEYLAFPITKWNSMSTSDGPKEMATYLLKEASDKDRDSITAYVKGLKDALGNLGIKDDDPELYEKAVKELGMDKPDYEQRVNDAVAMIQMGQPFAKPGTDFALHEPGSGGNPVPVKFAELEGLGNGGPSGNGMSNNYDKFENRAKDQNRQLLKQIQAYESMKPPDIASDIQNGIDKYNRDERSTPEQKEPLHNELKLKQMAWSYVAQKQMAQRIYAIDTEGAGGVEDPKVPAQGNVIGFQTSKVQKTLTRRPLQVRSRDEVSPSSMAVFRKALARVGM